MRELYRPRDASAKCSSGKRMHASRRASSEGEAQGAKVTCPWHRARFDLRTGAVIGPPARTRGQKLSAAGDGSNIEIER
jgi:nitrite reductase/ring-hydroxylating ferredoxin subunit